MAGKRAGCKKDIAWQTKVKPGEKRTGRSAVPPPPDSGDRLFNKQVMISPLGQ